MAEYRCIKSCFFNDRFHHEGKKYAFPDDLEVPKHFAKLGTKQDAEAEAKVKAKEAAQKAVPTTMHEAAKASVKVAEPSAAAEANGKADVKVGKAHK